MKALIVGGGIGGLTAALCLRRLGWQVQVLEQAGALVEVGAGIQLSPNACRVLRELDLLPALQAVAFAPEALEMRWGRSGREIFRIPLTPSRWDAPYLHVHRADLLAVLQQALQRLAPDALRLNAAVTGYQSDADGVVAMLADGQSVSGDLLIGADGIHSQIQRQILGATPARFTGNVAWRAVVPLDQLGEHAPPPSACVWAGPGRHAVTYRVRGGTLANFVGVVERSDWQQESWSEQGSRTDALADFAGWHPQVTQLIEKATVLHRWALFDRPPLPRWSEGRVVLLGDACHPMLPFMAQGAAMAIEDAWALGQCLQQQADPAIAAQQYFAQRYERCRQVQQAARRNARVFHQRHAAAYWPVWLVARLFPGLLLRRFDWIYQQSA